ncbi:MAG: signal peptidase II [Pseudomonadota bacterium]|nr:signal peptidase II [Pseudomonadota bacterium]|tara:strand:- start:837 stop:1322 length:486 start_codon:yes stop_codon:yes gene_type:complete
MERIIKNYLSVFTISVSVFLIDFLSKYKIISIFKGGDIEKIYVNQFLDFVLVFNTGVSYGLFSGGGNLQRWILIILSIAIIIFLLNFLKSEKSIIPRISISLIVGGALGNIFDRFVYGAVIDFISLHAKGFSWYIFNIADIFIVLGVILFILSQIFKFNSG